MLLNLIRRMCRKRFDVSELDEHTLSDIGINRMGLVVVEETAGRDHKGINAWRRKPAAGHPGKVVLLRPF